LIHQMISSVHAELQPRRSLFSTRSYGSKLSSTRVYPLSFVSCLCLSHAILGRISPKYYSNFPSTFVTSYCRYILIASVPLPLSLVFSGPGVGVPISSKDGFFLTAPPLRPSLVFPRTILDFQRNQTFWRALADFSPTFFSLVFSAGLKAPLCAFFSFFFCFFPTG